MKVSTYVRVILTIHFYISKKIVHAVLHIKKTLCENIKQNTESFKNI